MNVEEMKVTVVSAASSTGKVIVRDSFANEFEIDVNVRKKGVGFPAPSERWLIIRRGRTWLFEAQIGAPALPVVAGSRDGMHPVSVQLLEALSRQGLVYDETIGVPIPAVYDEDTDPPGDTGTADLDDDGEITEPDDPNEVPPKHNGPKGDGKDPDPPKNPGPKDPGGQDDPDRLWVPLYVGTYNIKFTLGDKRVKDDFNRLRQSRMQVWGSQENGAPGRNWIGPWAGDHGWGWHHPEDTPSSRLENAIFWRDDEFTKLDQGAVMLSDAGSSPDRNKKWAVWVKLLQHESQRSFYFISTHLLPHIEGRGHPHGDPAYLTAAFNGIDTIQGMMRDWGAHTPVITVGDWNINWAADARVRDHRFPYVKFKAADTLANWDLIKKRPSYGSHGQRLIDIIWLTKPKIHQFHAEEQWIFTGYHSDHKPVMAKIAVRRKSR